MIFSKIKLFGLLTLSYSLIACGQTQTSTAPNVSPTATPTATPTAIAQTITTSQPTETPALVTKSPDPQPTATASIEPAKAPDKSLTAESAKAPVSQLSTDVDVETLFQTFEEINKQRCDDRKSVIEKGSVYGACTANAGGRGQFRFISASQHIAEAPDVGGIVYWYYLNGKVAVITFAHDGTSFMFDRSGKLQAELISAQKVMLNGQEQFQNRSIRNTFKTTERDRLEKLAKGGGEEILAKFK